MGLVGAEMSPSPEKVNGIVNVFDRPISPVIPAPVIVTDRKSVV